MTGWEEIFSPGLRHWKEYQDSLDDKIVEVPAAGPGPESVDLDAGVITILADEEDFVEESSGLD